MQYLLHFRYFSKTQYKEYWKTKFFLDLEKYDIRYQTISITILSAPLFGAQPMGTLLNEKDWLQSLMWFFLLKSFFSQININSCVESLLNYCLLSLSVWHDFPFFKSLFFVLIWRMSFNRYEIFSKNNFQYVLWEQQIIETNFVQKSRILSQNVFTSQSPHYFLINYTKKRFQK